MAPTLFLLVGTFAVAAAQSSTAHNTEPAGSTTHVTILLPYFATAVYNASVVSIKDEVATFAINCVEYNQNECDFSTTATVVGGPSTMSCYYVNAGRFNDSSDPPFVLDLKCDLDRSEDVATCWDTTIWEELNTEWTTTRTETWSDISDKMAKDTVTAGLKKIIESEEGDGSATPGASAADTASAAITGTETTASASDTGSRAAEVGSSDTGNAVGPRATPNAALAGVAAVVGGAAIWL